MSYPDGGYDAPRNGPGRAPQQYGGARAEQAGYRREPGGYRGEQAGYRPVYPGYDTVDADEPLARSNPIAGVLLLIGSLAGLAACLVPNGQGKLPVMSAIDVLKEAGNSIPLSTGLFIGLAPLVLALGSLLTLIAGLTMFAARPHGGAAATALIGALLMLGCPVLLMIATNGKLVDSISGMGWVTVGAWLPALVGALLGFRR
ncbi:hypothetical protein [Cumulibacter manganitolerans]|uniref:hypothetical protein n=1 Tax=Cumulibacter manganitolerans TaxID=1884992 RepID=UPI001295F9FF|nr:hypothetical protein [Cumulibacter manganitolerans]